MIRGGAEAVPEDLHQLPVLSGGALRPVREGVRAGGQVVGVGDAEAAVDGDEGVAHQLHVVVKVLLKVLTHVTPGNLQTTKHRHTNHDTTRHTNNKTT